MHGKHGAQDRVTAGLLHDDIRVLALEVAPRSAQSFESGVQSDPSDLAEVPGSAA